MTVVFASPLVHRIRGAARIWLGCALLFGVGVPDAKAGFIAYYAPGNFTLTNYGGGVDAGTGNPTANGTALFPDLNTLVLTGTNDGSGIPGWTDLTIPALGDGLFQFNYVFTTLDIPGMEYAGYLVGATFFQLADTDGALNASGFVSVPVSSGELIGFRAGSIDSEGGLPAVLTITDFNAPVPEPGTFQLLLIVAVAAGATRLYSHRRRHRRS